MHIKNAKNDKSVELKAYESEAKHLTDLMEEAVAQEDYERAALLKMRISRLNEKIVDCQKVAQNDGKVILKINDIATAVSVMTGIPLEQLERSEATKLQNLEKRLARKIIGQKSAISAVARAIRRNRAGISPMKKPIGSFIFLGPTGVGKTELARVLAQEVFGSERNLIKIDMSEFSEKFTASRLVGAPAGYIGYDDGGTLTEKVRRQPYSVVLFDEIEKAHPQIFNLLLQILEDGRLTDGHGRAVDFSNTVIILTSNVGAAEMAREKIGFNLQDGGKKSPNLASANINYYGGLEAPSPATTSARGSRRSHDSTNSSSQPFTNDELASIPHSLREVMRPELLNRFDAIITFDSLKPDEIAQIFDLLIEDLNNRLAAKGVAVLVNAKVKKYLIMRGYDAKFGARPLKRTIQNYLEDLIAEKLISREITRGDVVKAELKDGAIVLEKVNETNRQRKDAASLRVK